MVGLDIIGLVLSGIILFVTVASLGAWLVTGVRPFASAGNRGKRIAWNPLAILEASQSVQTDLLARREIDHAIRHLKAERRLAAARVPVTADGLTTAERSMAEAAVFVS